MTTDLIPAVPGAEPTHGTKALELLGPTELQAAQDIARQFDAGDALELTAFGVEAQKPLSVVTDSLLKMTATKDADVGGVLTDLMLELKSLNSAGLAARTENALAALPVLGAWFDGARRLILSYESIHAKIERITVALDNARYGLSRDIILLEQLYERNSASHRLLRVYLGAGEIILRELRAEQEARRAAAAAAQDLMLAQQAADLANTIGRLETRLHDLILVEMLALQTATQLRVIQNGSQALVGRIQTSVLTTIPLWRIQMCIAIALVGQAKAIKIQNLVSATTNKLISANADKIHTLSAEAHTAAQQGIVGLDTLQHANDQLIATIEESLQIQEEGHRKRQEAKQVLMKLQDELREGLTRAERRAKGESATQGGRDAGNVDSPPLSDPANSGTRRNA